MLMLYPYTTDEPAFMLMLNYPLWTC